MSGSDEMGSPFSMQDVVRDIVRRGSYVKKARMIVELELSDGRHAVARTNEYTCSEQEAVQASIRGLGNSALFVTVKLAMDVLRVQADHFVERLVKQAEEEEKEAVRIKQYLNKLSGQDDEESRLLRSWLQDALKHRGL